MSSYSFIISVNIESKVDTDNIEDIFIAGAELVDEIRDTVLLNKEEKITNWEITEYYPNIP